MLELLTDRAVRVVEMAREEARALGLDYIGPEHLLVGLLRDEQTLQRRLLGTTAEAAHAKLVELVANGALEPISGPLESPAGIRPPLLFTPGTTERARF